MWNKLSAVSVSLAALALSGTALAAPKSAPTAKPSVPAPHQYPFQLHVPQPANLMPNMTHMPHSYLVAAFDVTVPGERLYRDISGSVIARSSSVGNGLVLIDPSPAKPKH